MRLWHLFFAVLLISVILTIARDPAGRVALVVFLTLVGETIAGLTAVMLLFRTVGAIGQAESPFAYVEALVATTLVLTVATIVMSSLLFFGAWLVQATVT